MKIHILLTAIGFLLTESAAFPADDSASDLAERCRVALGLIQTHQNDFQRALLIARKNTRAQGVNRHIEEFLTGFLQPLLGRKLLKSNPEGTSDSDFRKWSISPDSIFFDGFKRPWPALRVIWSRLQDVPSVKESGGTHTLIIPGLPRMPNKAWIKEWVPKLFPHWLKGHPLLKVYQNKVDDYGDELWDQLPLIQTTVTRKPEVSEVPEVSKDVEGIRSFGQVRPPVTLYHPEFGRIQITDKSTDNGGTLRIDLGNANYRYLKDQGKLSFALVDSLAHDEMVIARAQAFAPVEHIATLFLAQYLQDLGGKLPKTSFYETIEKTYDELYPDESPSGLAKLVRALHGSLASGGVRFEQAAALKNLRTKLGALTELVHRRTSLDLAQASLAHWMPEEGEFHAWPNLGIHRGQSRGENSVLLKQVAYQKKEITDYFLEKLAKDTRQRLIEGVKEEVEKKLEEKPSFAPVEFARPILSIGTAYYTSSHPKNETDPFSQTLMRLRESTESKNSYAPREATARARTLVAALQEPLKKAMPPDVDVITYVPGSENAKNRAYYLAQATAVVFDMKDKFQSNLYVRQGWKGAAHAQKFQEGLGERIRNAGSKFELSDSGEDSVEGKNVFLIEDTNTSGITIANARRLLLEGGAKSVTVFAFAQTVKEGQPEPDLPKFPVMTQTMDQELVALFQREKMVRPQELIPPPVSSHDLIPLRVFKAGSSDTPRLEKRLDAFIKFRPSVPATSHLVALEGAVKVNRLMDEFPEVFLKLNAVSELLAVENQKRLGLSKSQTWRILQTLDSYKSHILHRSSRIDVLQDYLSPERRFVLNTIISRSFYSPQAVEDARKYEKQIPRDFSGTLPPHWRLDNLSFAYLERAEVVNAVAAELIESGREFYESQFFREGGLPYSSSPRGSLESKHVVSVSGVRGDERVAELKEKIALLEKDGPARNLKKAEVLRAALEVAELMNQQAETLMAHAGSLGGFLDFKENQNIVSVLHQYRFHVLRNPPLKLQDFLTPDQSLLFTYLIAQSYEFPQAVAFASRAQKYPHRRQATFKEQPGIIAYLSDDTTFLELAQRKNFGSEKLDP